MIPHPNTAPVLPVTAETVRVPLTAEQTIPPAHTLLTWLLAHQGPTVREV